MNITETSTVLPCIKNIEYTENDSSYYNRTATACNNLNLSEQLSDHASNKTMKRSSNTKFCCKLVFILKVKRPSNSTLNVIL